MFKKIFPIVILVVLASLGLYFFLTFKKNPTSRFSPTINITFSKNREILENQIKILLEEANFCVSKMDCKVVGYGCPFGCSNLINTSYDVSLIEMGVEKYKSMGPTCIYDCDVPPKVEDISCINNKCVDTRY